MTQQFVTRTAADLDPDTIATSPTAYALYENPMAIARGAPAAPRISIHAIEELTAGDTVRYERAETQTNPSGSEVEALNWTFVQRGSVRITFEHSRTNGSGANSVVRIYKDGAELTSFSIGSNWTAQTYDLMDIVPGTVLIITHAGSATATSGVRNLRMRTAGTDIWPTVPYLKFSTVPT